MQEFAAAAKTPGKVYFTGGATALLLGLREQTIDIDLKLDPEPGGAFEAIAVLKNRLNLNVDASADEFFPAAADWRERSRFITSISGVDFFHYDFALQALPKLERGHTQDLEDVANLVRGGCITKEEIKNRFQQIEPQLLRYPALDPQRFRTKVENFLVHGSP